MKTSLSLISSQVNQDDYIQTIINELYEKNSQYRSIDVYLKHFLFSYTSYCHTWLFGRNSWHGCITFRKINHWCGNEILFEQNIYSHNFLTNSVKHNVFCLVTSSHFHCLVGQERKHVAWHWKVCSDDVVNCSNCCRRTSNDTNYYQNPAVDPFP